MNKKQFSKREYWLMLKLIDSLRSRKIPFEGPNEEFVADFNRIRDISLERAYDYKLEGK